MWHRVFLPLLSTSSACGNDCPALEIKCLRVPGHGLPLQEAVRRRTGFLARENHTNRIPSDPSNASTVCRPLSMPAVLEHCCDEPAGRIGRLLDIPVGSAHKCATLRDTVAFCRRRDVGASRVQPVVYGGALKKVAIDAPAVRAAEARIRAMPRSVAAPLFATAPGRAR